MARALTRVKRKNQRLRVFDLKLDERFMSKLQKNFLKRLYLEAKWFYNDILRQNVYKYDYKTKVVTRFDKDKNEIKETLQVLCAASRQDILEQIKSSIKGLATKKAKKLKVGKLKYKSKFNSISLRTIGIYRIKSNKLFLPKCKESFRLLGLSQLPKNCEKANAKLVVKADGFHLMLTTFENVDQINERKEYQNKSIGLDFGIGKSVVDSFGNIFNEVVKETERLKRLQRSHSRKKSHSNNYFKNLKKIKREYQRISNKKEDLSNKYVHNLFANNEIVCIQDDNFNAWKKKKYSKRKKAKQKKRKNGFSYGKKIQMGCLGRIKSKIKRNVDRISVVERFTPTTKVCLKCLSINKNITLSDRTFVCPECGHTENRDIHAAKNIARIGLENLCAQKRTKNIGMDGTKCVKRKKRASQKPEEMKTNGYGFDSKRSSLSLIDETGMEEVHTLCAPFQEDAKSSLA